MSQQRPVVPSGEPSKKYVKDCKNDGAVVMALAQMRKENYYKWWDAERVRRGQGGPRGRPWERPGESPF